MAAPVAIPLQLGTDGLPEYKVGGLVDVRALSVSASYNAVGSNNDVRPCVALFTADGQLIALALASSVVPAGNLATVTFARGLDQPLTVGELVAEHTVSEDLAASNPLNLIDRPCVLTGYVIDATALTDPVHVVFYDDSDSSQTNWSFAAPAPAELGANVKLPLHMKNGVGVAALNTTANGGGLYAGAAELYVSVFATLSV